VVSKVRSSGLACVAGGGVALVEGMEIPTTLDVGRVDREVEAGAEVLGEDERRSEAHDFFMGGGARGVGALASGCCCCC
jgi:hypothetical protein